MDASHFFAKTLQRSNTLDPNVCANGGRFNSRCSAGTLNGGPVSATTASGSSNSGSSRNGDSNRLVFLGNIYTRTNQLDKVTQC